MISDAGKRVYHHPQSTMGHPCMVPAQVPHQSTQQHLTCRPAYHNTTPAPLRPAARIAQARHVDFKAYSAMSTVNPGTSVHERRAADVVVLGNSCTAAATALSLARAGKKVLYLPCCGSSSSKAGQAEGTSRPLHLPHASQHMAA